jgi:hypothetical protein
MDNLLEQQYLIMSLQNQQRLDHLTQPKPKQ